MSEAELINGLRDGNETAFRKLVDNYRQMVVGTCFGILHNIDDAEDVAQEVFIEVFRSVKKFRGDSKLTTWLYRIAVNRSLNFIRDNKRYRRSRPVDDLAGEGKDISQRFISAETENPEYSLENRQRAVILHNAVDALPKNQRIVFVLSKYEDLSNREIAEVMNLSVSSVESLMYRAKKNLQKKLLKYYRKNIF